MGCLASLSQSLRYRHLPTPTVFWDGQKITAHFNLPNQRPWLTNEVSSRRYTSYTVDVALFEVLPAWRITRLGINQSVHPPPLRPFLQYVLKSPEDGAKTWLSCSSVSQFRIAWFRSNQNRMVPIYERCGVCVRLRFLSDLISILEK